MEKMEKLMELEYTFYSDKCDMHYKAVENAIKIYFIVIGLVISVFTAIYKDQKDLYNLMQSNSTLIIAELILWLVGCITFFRVLEHRLLILSYVRSLNGVRKWFCDTSSINARSYFLYKPDPNLPKYYNKNGHFMWELLGLALINSCWLVLMTLGTLRLNFIFLILIYIISTCIQMVLYKHIARIRENQHIIKTD
jgi:hypothetical protein